MPLPIGDREEFRRDDHKRLADRHRKATGIGVVAAAQFDGRLDQKAAGVIADRTERIVVGFQSSARRLAIDGAGHRRSDRRLVGGLRRRNGQAHAPARRRRRCGGSRRAGSWRFGPGLAGIKFRPPACAIERIEPYLRGAAGSRQAVNRNTADARGRRRGTARPLVAGGIAETIGAVLADSSQRRILWGEESVTTGAQEIGGEVWACVQDVPKAISARHGKTARSANARLLRPVAGPDPTVKIPQRIHTLDVLVPEPALACWKTS